ncbi:MAG: translation initiation factor IF-3 [Firmicutes bacterium]|nr:translation initiation factor IF-3 [Bacillota bacterium]
MFLYIRFYFVGRHSGGEITISKEALINEEIRDAEVRVIDETGAMLGILPIEEALRLAEERNLDLVNVSPNANPPVCKILDYGKYRYEVQKREKDAKKRQKVTEVKEVRLSTFIEEHDIQVKAKNASKFLQEGNRVKVSLRLRGRERDYANHAIEVMNDFAESLSDICTVDKKPKFEGRGITMFLSPKSDKDK